ncbi:efflux transporter outer membrane subunit [Comamonas composti]|uniref:efflux transporter outer membrane subunit n=1 Tax=Comamonas composti TaxID=408558 RepID=UPI001FE0406D|nr:efflux transporter outer membrane subunit [Comamonas composti]
MDYLSRLSLRPPAMACALLALSLSACNLAPVLPQPSAGMPTAVDGEGVQASPIFASEQSLEQANALNWVKSPRLAEVIALALSHNRDLRVAVANMEKARAQYGITSAAQLPTVNAQAQGSRSRSAADLSSNGQAAISEQYTAQLGFASFELDLWGRLRNLSEAGLQQFLQSQANQRNVQIGLIADTATAWLNLAANLDRLQLAQDTLTTREQSVDLTSQMFKLGAATGLAVAQSLALRDASQGEVFLYEAEVQRSRNALQLLTGGPVPEDLLPDQDATAKGQALGPISPVPPDISSGVLLQRPDILAAEHNLRAMNASIGAARANLFPTISLTASVGSGSRELDQLFAGGNRTWSFIPLIKLPIFDGGANRAGVEVAQANQQIALAQYEKTVQTAFRETADALLDQKQWALRHATQKSQVQASQKVLDLSQALFTAGSDNYLSVLDAQRSLYTAQQTLISLRLSEQLNRVTLWKVLGGELA